MKKHRMLLVVLLSLIATQTLISQRKQMTPKDECEELLNQLFPFADQMLNKYGEFFPYGSVMNNDKTIMAVAFYNGNEKPRSQDVINDLIKTYSEDAKKMKIRASGIAWDARIKIPDTDKVSDAVIVSLEHNDKYSVQVVFPYEIKNGKVIWNDTFSMEGKKDVFK
jgi:hypothetical protein